MGEGIADARFEPLALGRPLTWKYRGQVVPTNKLIQSTLEITERGKDARGRPYAVADASLWVDGKRIYEAKHVAMRIVSGVPTEKRRRRARSQPSIAGSAITDRRGPCPRSR